MPLFFGVSSPEKAFTCNGFRDWKHATGKSGSLSCHDSKCISHKEAILAWNQYKLVTARDASIAVQLDSQRKTVIQNNRKY